MCSRRSSWAFLGRVVTSARRRRCGAPVLSSRVVLAPRRIWSTRGGGNGTGRRRGAPGHGPRQRHRTDRVDGTVRGSPRARGLAGLDPPGVRGCLVHPAVDERPGARRRRPRPVPERREHPEPHPCVPRSARGGTAHAADRDDLARRTRRVQRLGTGQHHDPEADGPRGSTNPWTATGASHRREDDEQERAGEEQRRQKETRRRTAPARPSHSATPTRAVPTGSERRATPHSGTPPAPPRSSVRTPRAPASRSTARSP